MKERPILFKGEMVCAILSGQKTQTRRVVKPTPPPGARYFGTYYHPDPRPYYWAFDGDALMDFAVPSPYGQPGDWLWVRETYFAFGRWEIRFSVKKGRDEWHFIDLTLQMDRQYQFEDPSPSNRRVRGDLEPTWWKRPAIFMPRAASRITLEIADVRVRRLQDISEEDAAAEGVYAFHSQSPGLEAKPYYRSLFGPKNLFSQLWESINGLGSWDANPWVWAIEFKRVDQSEDIKGPSSIGKELEKSARSSRDTSRASDKLREAKQDDPGVEIFSSTSKIYRKDYKQMRMKK